MAQDTNGITVEPLFETGYYNVRVWHNGYLQAISRNLPKAEAVDLATHVRMTRDWRGLHSFVEVKDGKPLA